MLGGLLTGPGKGHLSAGNEEQRTHVLDRNCLKLIFIQKANSPVRWNCVLTETGSSRTRATEVADACNYFFFLDLKGISSSTSYRRVIIDPIKLFVTEI